MRVEIKRLTEQFGVTGVFVTHDQMEAMSMSDDIIVFKRGSIEQQGTPEEIYNHPKTLTVAKFVGKSNWITDNKMFRPEAVSFEKIADGMEFIVKVESVQFLGNGYMLDVTHEGRKWVLETRSKYKIGEELAIYVKENDIITV